jgi:integrase
MPFKRTTLKSGQQVWKFRVKISSCTPPEIKDTIKDCGQSEHDLKLHEAELIKLLKKKSADTIERERKITFGMYIDHYENSLKSNRVRSIIQDFREALGNIQIKNGSFLPVEIAFEKFMIVQKDRKVRRYKIDPVTCDTKLTDTDKTISATMLQTYRRYFSLICNHGTKLSHTDKLPRISPSENPSLSITVGKTIARTRIIEKWELDRIYNFLNDPKNLQYKFMLPLIDFSRTNPIRPGDITRLLHSQIDKNLNQIHYLPEKTSHTGTIANPIIFPVSQEYIYNRIGDTECSTIFYRQVNGKRLPLTYNIISYTWKYIMSSCEISNLQFYDLRHDAVNLLLTLGFNDRQIMQIAGWNTVSMLSVYDNRDSQRLANAAKEILQSNKDVLKEVA